MERESFIFYRSFYEAIRRMPPEVQAEIYPTLAEYALFGTAPKGISDVAMAIFLLIQPNIDVNSKRFENGKKGADYGKRGGRPKKKTTANPEYTLTFEQEVEQMKTDPEWSKAIRTDYALTPEEITDRLTRFLKHCNDTRKTKPHDSFDDAKSHLRYWMDKAYPPSRKDSTPTLSANQPASTSISHVQRAKEEERQRREAEYEERQRNAVPPDQLIRDLGYDPAEVSLAQALNPEWRDKNPPLYPPKI